MASKVTVKFQAILIRRKFEGHPGAQKIAALMSDAELVERANEHHEETMRYETERKARIAAAKNCPVNRLFKRAVAAQA